LADLVELSSHLGHFLSDNLLKILDATLRSGLAFHLLSTRLTRRLGVTSAVKHSSVSGVNSRARKNLSPIEFDPKDPIAAKRHHYW
jgi:hypothetical protein